MTIAGTVNKDRKLAMQAVAIGPSETGAFWTHFLRPLAERGPRGVKFVIAEDHLSLLTTTLSRVVAFTELSHNGRLPRQAPASLEIERLVDELRSSA